MVLAPVVVSNPAPLMLPLVQLKAPAMLRSPVPLSVPPATSTLTLAGRLNGLVVFTFRLPSVMTTLPPPLVMLKPSTMLWLEPNLPMAMLLAPRFHWPL